MSIIRRSERPPFGNMPHPPPHSNTNGANTVRLAPKYNRAGNHKEVLFGFNLPLSLLLALFQY
eukprot:1178538-Prorocentrum_minimum.AAC.1